MIPRRKAFFSTKIWTIFKKDNLASEKLEKILSEYLDVSNVVLVSSGRVALKLILETSQIQKGSEVIIPGLTFGYLAEVIKSANLVPKPVDVDLKTFQMSIKEVEIAISEKTGAILATHLFGEPGDIKSLLKIARKNQIILIEDCAQSFGAKINTKMTGTFGDISFSSFNIAKTLQGISGGVIFGNDIKWLKKIEKKVDQNSPKIIDFKTDLIRGLMGHLMIKTPFWFMLMYLISFEWLQKLFTSLYRSAESVNPSMALPNFFAKIILVNFENYDSRIEKRLEIRSLYNKFLNKILDFPIIEKDSQGVVYMVPGLVKFDPLKLRRFLAIKGIDIAISKEVVDCLLGLDSNSWLISQRIISLPVYENLKKRDIAKVAKLIKVFMKHH